jgi:hypothetical protein
MRVVAEDLPRLLQRLEEDAQVSLANLIVSITTEVKTLPCVAHGEERPYPAARLSLMFETQDGANGPSVQSTAVRELMARVTTNYFLAFGRVPKRRPPRPGDPPAPTLPDDQLKPKLRDLRVDMDGNVVANIVLPFDQAAVDRLLASIANAPDAPVPGAWIQDQKETQLMRKKILQVDLRGALALPGSDEPEPEPEPEPPAQEPATPGAPSAEEIRAAIEATLGAPFAKAGANPKKGLSPAGLVRYVHARLGMRDLPKSTRAIHADPRGELVPRKGYRPELGDVLFFVVKRGGKKMRYPGLLLDPKTGTFVVALAKKGVVRMRLGHPNWKKRFESAKRFLGR